MSLFRVTTTMNYSKQRSWWFLIGLMMIFNGACVCNGFVMPSSVGTSVRRMRDDSITDKKWGVSSSSVVVHPAPTTCSSTQLSAGILSGMNMEDIIFSVQSSASGLAETSMSGENGGILSLLVLYIAGLLTSFSPCSLGLLPLTVSYISTAAGERSDKAAFIPTVAFAAGLASVFCALGLSVSLLGGVFGTSTGSSSGQAAIALATLPSLVSLVMGMQLLEIVNVPLPSFDLRMPFTSSPRSSSSSSSTLLFDDDGNLLDPNSASSSSSSTNAAIPLLKTFLLGGSSALVASPCATPVLTSLLAFVAASQNPTYGASLLFTYTAGYSTPLLVIGATGGQALAKAQEVAMKGTEDDSIVAMIGRAVSPVTAAVLIYYGTMGFLNAVLGDPSLNGLAPVFQ